MVADAERARFGLAEWTTEVGPRRFTVAAGSEVGTRYRANFDVFATDRRWPAVVVADGMGDSPGSAVASRTAVDVFLATLAAGQGRVDTPDLRHAVAEAQRQVRQAGAQQPYLTGCTLTALVASGDEGWIVQVGDSRAYRLRSGLLELLTVDHTAAWLGAVYGWYPADSPAAAQARYQLHRYIGHPGHPEPDLLATTLRAGDVYCVCTDGLAEQVSYQRLADRLGNAEPAAAVADLLADSLASGGADNATIAVLRVDS